MKKQFFELFCTKMEGYIVAGKLRSATQFRLSSFLRKLQKYVHHVEIEVIMHLGDGSLWISKRMKFAGNFVNTNNH